LRKPTKEEIETDKLEDERNERRILGCLGEGCIILPALLPVVLVPLIWVMG
jgi:hypothetical protein